jgi:heat shock protein HtpX
MSRGPTALVSVLMGVAVFLVYAGLSVASALVLWAVVLDPPPLWVLSVVFVAAVAVFGYVAHRLGTIRLLTSLESTQLSCGRAPTVYRRLERLTAEMGLRQPQLLVAEMDAPNAFSLGTPTQSAIVLDSRLFSLLTPDELEAILAHELAHIERRDTLLQTLVVTAMRLLVTVVFVLLAPITLLLLGIDRGTAWIAGRPRRRQYGLAWVFQRSIQFTLGALFSVLTLGLLAYSRKREFAADSRAAEVTGHPVALARALAKIHRASIPRRGILSLLYIEQKQQRPPEWLSTHPETERRIERLLARADQPVESPAVARLRR